MGTTKAIVLHPYTRKSSEMRAARAPEYRLEEAVSLTRAIKDIDVIHERLIPLSRIAPATLLTKGHVEDIKALVEDMDIALVVIDHALTPIQQRNLEKEWNVKVIDRTGLILEIFGARAKTREGKLQVELAAMTFQRSRLVRSWTHLERQRGGLGFVGGPGETQIEIDRRLIGEKITRLKDDLEKVRRTRGLQRKARSDVPYPVVALVGYTNAGKSTLFNALTGADVFAKNLLFATLDTTMRAIDLEQDLKIILSDTVGFISDLPTHLIAAFRATLEEVEEADIILHVRDIASPQTESEREDVLETLDQLGIDTESGHIYEVWNKIDLLQGEGFKRCLNQAERRDDVIAVSALHKRGLDELKNVLVNNLKKSYQDLEINVPYDSGDLVSWLYRNATVTDRHDREEDIHFKLKASIDVIGRLNKKMAAISAPMDRTGHAAD